MTCFDVSVFAVIKRSIISFKPSFSSQEIRIMALELRWQKGLGVGSFSVFICLTILIICLKTLENSAGQTKSLDKRHRSSQFYDLFLYKYRRIYRKYKQQRKFFQEDIQKIFTLNLQAGFLFLILVFVICFLDTTFRFLQALEVNYCLCFSTQCVPSMQIIRVSLPLMLLGHHLMRNPL